MREAELLQKLSDMAGVEVDAERLGDELRSTRRQRTTPSLSRFGPASTRFANAVNCAADRRGFGPSVQYVQWIAKKARPWDGAVWVWDLSCSRSYAHHSAYF